MTFVNGVVGAVPIRRTARMLGMCIREARPSVLVIFLMRFLCGAVLSTPTTHEGALKRIGFGSLIWMLAIFFIYLLNGVMDVHEDRVNASRRPIAAGALAGSTAGRVARVAALLSVCGAVALGPRFVAALGAVLVVGYLYSAPPLYLKRHPVGTLAVGALLGLSTYYAGHAVAGGGDGRDLPTFAIAMSLWMGLVGTLAKDLPDVVGDAAAGRRTLAVLVEERRLRLLISASALGLAAAFTVFARALTPVLLGPALAVLAGAGAVATLCLSRFSRHGRAPRRRPYRAFMVTQYLAHISTLARVTFFS